ncbi:unknown [Clostridium sp. CAG:306]|nr:unknown [Clostridium sp. CAG:306]
MKNYKSSCVFYYIIFVIVAAFLYDFTEMPYKDIVNTSLTYILLKMLYIAFGLFVIQIILIGVYSFLDKNKSKTLEEKVTIVFLVGALLILGMFSPIAIKYQVLEKRMTQIYNKIDNLENVTDDSVLYEIQEMSDVININDYEREKRLY